MSGAAFRFPTTALPVQVQRDYLSCPAGSTPNESDQVTVIDRVAQGSFPAPAEASNGNTAKVLGTVSVKQKMKQRRPNLQKNGRGRVRRALGAFTLVAVPMFAYAAWQTVISEPGRRVEIDRATVVAGADGQATARGRIVLEKPIVDPKTSASYRIIEVESRYDCNERTYATLKRTYFKEEGEILRQEEVRSPFDMPVRSGTPDDRLLREACRLRVAGVSAPEKSPSAAAPEAPPSQPSPPSPPIALAAPTGSGNKTIEKANAAASELRKINEALVAQAVARDAKQQQTHAAERARIALAGDEPRAARAPAGSATPPPAVSWAYAGTGGPENWARLKADYALCGSGRRQSPIDVRDGIAVDLEPIQFDYRPAPFRVVDNGRGLHVTVYGGGFNLLGKKYELQRIQFHRPAEITIAGKTFEMDAQLVHKTDDGKLAVVTVLFEPGSENPVVQTALNNLPLEKGGEVQPPALSVDATRLLPDDRRYYTFMGSLTTPPCNEDVLWIVLKKPQAMSADQVGIFARLYPPNARPTQPVWGRIVKESR